MRSIKCAVLVCIVLLNVGCATQVDVLETLKQKEQSFKVELPTDKNAINKRLQTMLSAKGKSKEQITKDQEGAIRLEAIHNTAYVWALREGLYTRTNQIQKLLEENGVELDMAFSFSPLLLSGGKITPPVVLEAQRIYDQTAPDRARTVSVSYTLSKNAELVPFAPTWREYLLRSVNPPVEPEVVLLPRNSKESREWKKGIKSGWTDGVKQADDVFDFDLRGLQMDLEGMYRYHKLLAQGVVDEPTVSSSHVSLERTADGRTININDVIYEITVKSRFTDQEGWKPYFVGDRK